MPESAPMIQYRQQFIGGFAQRETYLRETVTKEAVFKGNQATFLVANDNATAITRGINGAIPYQPNDTSQFTVTLREKHVPIEMTGFNIFQSQGDQKAIMQMRSMNGLNRDFDAEIIAALATATTTTAAAVASLNWFTSARAILRRNNVPNNGLTMLLTPDAEKQLLRVGAFTSADFVNEKPLLTAGGGGDSPAGYYNYLGCKLIVMNGLPGAGTAAAECLLYHRDAIGHACNSDDVQVAAGYDEKQDSSWSRTTAYHGALLLQNSGVIRVRHDDTIA